MIGSGQIWILIAVLGFAPFAQAQARTWAFSKDTVYEWAANGDSLSLVNSGIDTLRFDSIGLELVRPTATSFGASFYFIAPETRAYFLTGSQATADCRGTLQIMRHVGNSAPITAEQQWLFTMRRLAGRWVIRDVSVSQAPPIAALRVRRNG